MVRSMMRFASIALSLFFWFAVPAPLAAADTPSPIVGAGAHFAWVVFDRLKPDLERAAGRPFQVGLEAVEHHPGEMGAGTDDG